MTTLLEKSEAMLAAVSFAEEGEVETARWMMAEAGVGTKHVAVAHGGHGKPIGTMVVTGGLSLLLYTALLQYGDQVNGTFVKAGPYAILPILTAFLFSFIHGTFTDRFWTVMGVEASSKKGGAKHHA